MLYRTEGIVLKSFPFGDADLIVTILTKDFGLIKVFAKSPRKTKSRFGSSLEPFTFIRMAYWAREGSELPRLTQADILISFQTLRNKIAHYLKITEIFEITINLLPEREENKEILSLLLGTMKSIEKGINNKKMNMNDQDFEIEKKSLFYKIKLLSISGFTPRLNGCAICGNNDRLFYIQEGSIICKRCISNYYSENDNKNREIKVLSQGAINLFERIRRWEWDKISRILPSKRLIEELDNIITMHIRYRTEKNIKTREFIQKAF